MGGGGWFETSPYDNGLGGREGGGRAPTRDAPTGGGRGGCRVREDTDGRAGGKREGGRGNGGGLGVEGVLMGGMVARRIEGMGPRIREETGGGRGNGGGLGEEGFTCARGNGRGARERRGVGGRGRFNGGDGNKGE